MFGVGGVYFLHELNALEEWSKQKFEAEFTKKLERNRARARHPCSAILPLTLILPSPHLGQDAMDDTYQSVLGDNYSKWFGPKVV